MRTLPADLAYREPMMAAPPGGSGKPPKPKGKGKGKGSARKGGFGKPC